MPEIQLTPRERQALKGRAHALKPVVLLGAAGLSPAVLAEIDRALSAHALIKVKVPGDDRTAREELFATVADTLSAARVQAIGKLLVFYRPIPDEETRSDAVTASEQRGARSAQRAVSPARRGNPPRDKTSTTKHAKAKRNR